MVLAAYETSSTALTFCMYELAVNEDIQCKLRESIRTVLTKNELNYKSLNEMTYLDQCVKGTFDFFENGLVHFKFYRIFAKVSTGDQHSKNS